MGIAKPFGGHAEQMLDPDAWPEADEDVLFDRAHAWTQILHRVAEVLGATRRQRAEMFEADGWSGAAAAAADGELSGNIDELVALQNMLATVITWQRYVAGTIFEAKAAISDNVEIANQRINAVVTDSRLTADARRAAIEALVSEAYLENAGVVAATAEQIRASRWCNRRTAPWKTCSTRRSRHRSPLRSLTGDRWRLRTKLRRPTHSARRRCRKTRQQLHRRRVRTQSCPGHPS